MREDGASLPGAPRPRGVRVHRGSPRGNPLRGSEVHRLGDVEPVREPRVVRPGPRDDELPLALARLEHLHAVRVPKRRGRRQGDEFVQKVRVPLDEVRRHRPQRRLKRLRARARNPVPRLGRAAVVVVHAAQVVVLHVPAEGAEEHAEVEPGAGQTGDVRADDAEEVRGVRDELVEIPGVVGGGGGGGPSRGGPRNAAAIIRVVLARTPPRETGAVDVRVEVAAVLHLHRLDVRLRDAPELLLRRQLRRRGRVRGGGEAGRGCRRRGALLGVLEALVLSRRRLALELEDARLDARVGLAPTRREGVGHRLVRLAGVPPAILEVDALLEAVDGLELRLERDAVAAGVGVELGAPT